MSLSHAYFLARRSEPDTGTIRARCLTAVRAAGLLSVLLVSSVMAHAQLVTSTFDADTEGWGEFNDGGTPTWVPAGGNPGGTVSVVDQGAGSFWAFVAPAKFLGSKSDFYGGSLSYDIRSNQVPNAAPMPTVTLVGNGTTLVAELASATTGWTANNIVLDETAPWRVTTLGGAVPTPVQFQSVLSNVTALRIRGEYRNGADTGFLDNVRMAGVAVTVPETNALALFALAGIPVAAVALHRRRRK
ncbi:MAG: PEP-CTERM sorting domain-containing protein [Fibrella sp.]|nr:PEP-CTERM sorting domain-containing protein [Armatimonadota bacterium]